VITLVTMLCMEHTNTDALLKTWRKKPLFDPESLPVKLDVASDSIIKLIPHRPPLLYVDKIISIDVSEGLIAASRKLEVDDPVFKGHFPDFPVYPGNFTVETIGQAGLCLYYFIANNRSDIATDAKPVTLRATKISGALFLEPIFPGDEITILCKKLSWDGYFASILGQAIVRGKVSVVAIGEVMILEE